MHKVNRYIIMLLVTLSLMVSGCAKFKQIRPVSANIESLMPSGLRSAVVVLAIEIDNPAMLITLSDIQGRLERSGKVLGRVVLDPFILEAKTMEKYRLRATVILDQSASLMDVLALTRAEALEECVADIRFKATLKSGISKKMVYEDLPLVSLMKM